MLPVEMESPAAMAMMVAIALQESRLTYRHQVGGPAKSYYQFEQGGGVKGVLTHPSTRTIAAHVCNEVDVIPAAIEVYTAIEYHDILASVFARLLLWTLPQGMPNADDPEAGWQAYVCFF